jgi:hypothetical protein
MCRTRDGGSTAAPHHRERVISSQWLAGNGEYGDMAEVGTHLHVIQPVLTFLDPFLPECGG